MYHVSAKGIDKRMINVHYYYYNFALAANTFHQITRNGGILSLSVFLSFK